MNSKTIESVSKILEVYKKSGGEIRPHFILAGASGSGKSYTVRKLCKENNIRVINVTASQITKEGVSGNSLSKALVPLGNLADKPVVCFVDEIDKLFLTDDMTTTNMGVQDEFLTMLESDTTQVMGDYGKYRTVDVSKVLFVFAGAFDNCEVDYEHLVKIGMRREFLGRVNLIYQMKIPSLAEMKGMLRQSTLLFSYQKILPDELALDVITEELEEKFEDNDIGIRLINKLIHQYFLGD